MKSFLSALTALAAALLLCATPGAAAVAPDQVLLVVNEADPEGVRLAEYYMKKRRIPPQNMIRIDTGLREDIAREGYEKQIAAPVRTFLSSHDPWGIRFRCLLTMYGIPLLVEAPLPTREERTRIAALQKRLSGLREKEKPKGALSQETVGKVSEEIAGIQQEINRLHRHGQGAAVDSELALVMEEPHRLEGWLPNRYFLPFRGKDPSGMPRRVLAVSRLDGPSPAVVYRVIDDSLAAEEEGLTGTAYFDARAPLREGKDLNGYERYDRAIHRTARLVEKSGKLKVVLDQREALFEAGTAPDAALYCGWYSLGKYIDAFTWKRGAVGYHVASAECTTLKTPSSTVWCKAMLDKGIAATLGPVAEPYVSAFPLPEIFFPCLLDGNSLVDCYMIANPFWSWQMVLLGDPLYRPFKAAQRAPRK